MSSAALQGELDTSSAWCAALQGELDSSSVGVPSTAPALWRSGRRGVQTCCWVECTTYVLTC